MPQEIKVRHPHLLDYTRNMVRYAVYNHPDELIHLLQSNGISVPNNVDYKTLHIMVLKSMMSSESFKNGLSVLLKDVAMENEYARYKKDGFMNAGGKAPDAPPDQNKSWFAQTFTPDTVKSLLDGGLALLTDNLQKSGDAGINTEVNTVPPPQTPPKSNVPLIIGSVLVIGAVIGVGYYLYNRKK